MNKQKIVLCALVMSALFPMVSAQVDKIHLLGEGIVVSPQDSTDFKLLRIVTGEVKVEGESFKLGVMFLDGPENKYKLIVSSASATDVTATVYKGDTEAGKISVTKVKKPSTEVWAGTLVLDGTTYYIYVISAPRDFRGPEVGDRVAEFCAKNPAVCEGASKEACDNNPEAEPCQRVMKAFCAENKDDFRCRRELGSHCEQNPDAPECRDISSAPPKECIKCMEKYMIECGLTKERCGDWEKFGPNNPPKCQPTQEEIKCIESKAKNACVKECSVMQAPRTSPAEPPRAVPYKNGKPLPANVPGIAPGEICTSQCTTVCKKPVDTSRPDISCYEKMAEKCVATNCVTTQSGGTDESCVFKCKVDAKEQCQRITPIEDFGIKPSTESCPATCLPLEKAKAAGCTVSDNPRFSCGPDASLVCAKCPVTTVKPDCACTQEWLPVCGKDEKTYSNKCFAYCAGVEVSKQGRCETKCGDGVCEFPEKEQGCEDCKPKSFCGNNVCEPGEYAGNCLTDCKPKCGDGYCSEGEDANTCSVDCASTSGGGSGGGNGTPEPKCGNSVCETGEDANNCSVDCVPTGSGGGGGGVPSNESKDGGSGGGGGESGTPSNESGTAGNTT